MLKVNNSNTRGTCKICSNLTLKTPKRRHWRCSGVFFVNFEHIFTPPSVFIVDFEQVMFAETVRCFTSFTRKQKFHHVFLKNVTHFSTYSKPQSLSCRNQSIWFVVDWTPGIWNKRECEHSNSHTWTENKRCIQNPVKHLKKSLLQKYFKGFIFAKCSIISQDAPSLMFDTVLNTLVEYENIQGKKWQIFENFPVNYLNNKLSSQLMSQINSFP